MVWAAARFHKGWIHWVMYTVGGGIMAVLWLPAEMQTQKRGCKKHFCFTWPVISSKFSLRSLKLRWTACGFQTNRQRICVDVMCLKMRELLEEHFTIKSLGDVNMILRGWILKVMDKIQNRKTWNCVTVKLQHKLQTARKLQEKSILGAYVLNIQQITIRESHFWITTFHSFSGVFANTYYVYMHPILWFMCVLQLRQKCKPYAWTELIGFCHSLSIHNTLDNHSTRQVLPQRKCMQKWLTPTRWCPNKV